MQAIPFEDRDLKGTKQMTSRRLQRFFPALILTLSVASAEGNSIQVTPSAALEGAYGFRITLDDPTETPPREAWMAVGPEKGIAEETAVYGSFSMDLTNLTMGNGERSGPRRRRRISRAQAQVSFLSLSRDLDPASATVVVFLEQGSGGNWFLGAHVWNDSLVRFAEAGKAPLSEPQPGTTSVAFEWGAASSPGAHDGYLRLFQMIEGQPTLLFERNDLDNGAQVLNYMQVGMVDVSRQFPGTYGDLYLDELELNREPSP
jgi:hypothetical protein